MVVFVLQQEGGRGLSSDVRADVRIELDAVVGTREMPGLEGDGKVRPAALPVGSVDGWVEAMSEMHAHCGVGLETFSM